ncbi:MAG: glycoside hydrolase family 9 protein [Oscillospiraceae bacterium]|jgi:hypothetical protein|nr:glycoside hydrolase family 9 protein [Oscillospiraceae bacterium]
MKDDTAWIRINEAGYSPKRKKIAIVLSEQDITGKSWSLKNNGKTILEGTLQNPIKGAGHHLPIGFFSYKIDISLITTIGDYTLELQGAETKQVYIRNDPYSKFMLEALSHAKVMRSGCKTPLSEASHIGDAKAIVYKVNGDWKDGKWEKAQPERTLDMLGGHYDAGDYIKFTLTEASLAWHLLEAYSVLLAKDNKDSELSLLLDEIKHSLDYLAKTFPDENIFVIQVGDGKDHNYGWRLPDEDVLREKRPALCALSRTQMGSTAAVLAFGARVFKEKDAKLSTFYEDKAIAIYKRAREKDTHKSAFERDDANDFYYDYDDTDNMALAAIELYHLTQSEEYLNDCKEYAPSANEMVSWAEFNATINLRLAQNNDKRGTELFLEEMKSYYNVQNSKDNVWNLPLDDYTWGVLPVWIGMANHLYLAELFDETIKGSDTFYGVLDYVFGCNNWGIPMIATFELQNSIKNVYNQRTHLLKQLAVGALSEGPACRKTHEQHREHFFEKTPKDNPYEKFNTPTAVFDDNAFDYVISESTIWGQGNVILMLALAE